MSETGVIHQRMWRERLTLPLLVVVQMCQMIDFMVVVPLGSQLMRVLDITPTQFGLLLTVYAGSAGVSGFVAAMFVDRYDRRRTLLLLFAGFGLTALAAGFAPSYGYLLATRLLAGIFGGVLSGTLIAIVTDVFPLARRGRALGTLMSSFSLMLILGLPASMMLASALGWRAVFLALAVITLLALPVCSLVIPPVRGHVAAGRARSLALQLRGIFQNANHIRVVVLQFLMVFSGFIVMCFVAPYLVENVGVEEADLGLCYLFGGIAALVSAQVVGRLIDVVGRHRVFTVMMVCSFIGALMATNFPPAPLWAAVLLLMYLYSFFATRQIPAMAIITAAIQPEVRGGVLSIMSSLQQLALGMASFAASVIVARGPGGELVHYELTGLVSVLIGISALWLSRRIQPVA